MKEGKPCDVCGAPADPSTLYGYVGKDTRLCMTGRGCFAWFSGYPWTLFEMEMLVSRLWEPGDDPHPAVGRWPQDLPVQRRWNTWGNW